MDIRRARLGVLVRALRRGRRCRFSCVAIGVVVVGDGKKQEYRSRQSGWLSCASAKGRRWLSSQRRTAKCMLAQGERCARSLRQGKVNSQSRAESKIVLWVLLVLLAVALPSVSKRSGASVQTQAQQQDHDAGLPHWYLCMLEVTKMPWCLQA